MPLGNEGGRHVGLVINSLAPTPAELGRQRSECVLLHSGHVCLFIWWMVCLLINMCYTKVCVYWSYVQSLMELRVAFPGMGVSFACSNVCVYCVCAHYAAMCFFGEHIYICA